MGETDSELAALLSSASLVFVGSIVGSLAKLVERIIIGRELTVGGYGTVSVALALMSLSITISMAGFTQGIPRYMARFDDAANVRGSWVTGVIVTGTLALAVSAVLFVFGDEVTAALFGSEMSLDLLYLFVLAIPFLVGFRGAIGGIRGHENTIYKLYVGDLLYPLSRILLLVVFLYFGFGIYAAGFAYLIAAIVAFLAALLLFNRLISLFGEFNTHLKEMVRFSTPLVFSTILSVLLTRTDTLMLGYFQSTLDVGIYSAAYPIATGMLVILSSFGFLYLPLASRLDADGEREEIDTIYKLTTKWIYVVTFPAFLAFAVFPSDVLTIFFDQRYAQGGLVLSILSVGFFTNAAFGRNRETISALGRTEFIMVANTVALGLNIALNLALIPEYSYLGAGVASAISYVSLNLVIYAFLKFKMDISPFSEQSLRTYLVLPTLLAPPAIVLSQWVTLTVPTLVAFLVATGILSLVVVTATGCLQSEDMVVLDAFESRTGLDVGFVRRFIPQ